MNRHTLIGMTTAAIGAVAALAPSTAHAGFYRWTYSNPANAWANSIVTEFDPDTNRFKWEFTVSNNANGYWLSVSTGGGAQGRPGQFAAIFFDASNLGQDMTVTPRVTIYGYNGLGMTTSWYDGSNAPGMQAPDRIFSSLDPTTAGMLTQLSATDAGPIRTFVLEMDASVINNHMPLYPNPAGNDWTGVRFGPKIGHWFHPVAGLTAGYGTDPDSPDHNYLTNFGYSTWGFSDMVNLDTQFVPTPGALALLGLAGLMGLKRRRG